MKIAMSKTREMYPLSHKKIWKKTIRGTLVPLVAFFVIWALVFLSAFGSETSTMTIVVVDTVIFGLLSAILFFSVYFYQRWYFATYYYELDANYVVIKKGPITPQEITIPYERIQDVYVDQDLLDRILGIYDVHISSATISSGMQAHIDGVEKPAADGLRGLLLQTVSEKINRVRNIQSQHSGFASTPPPPPVPVPPPPPVTPIQ